VKQIFTFRNSCLIFAGPLISSLSVYLILSGLLLFPSDIAVTLSVIMFSLLLGLSSYLLLDGYGSSKNRNDLAGKNSNAHSKRNFHKGVDNQKISTSHLIYIAIYIISIIIAGTAKPLDINGELFIAWNHLSPMQIVQLGSAVLLSFFLPGYALVYLLVKNYHLESLPKILLSFLFSMLLLGFSVYAVAILIGVPLAQLNQIIIGIDVLILGIFIIYQKWKKTLSVDFDTIATFFAQFKSRNILTIRNTSQFMVFASLFALVIFYTYYLEKGVIVGDQWFHHGRALLIDSGEFKDVGDAYTDRYYPPFFSSLLAGFFSLSGAPSANAYVSLNFLNMLSVFAFYYFFTRWAPSNQLKAVVLASTLFVLSSGFGWIQVLTTSMTNIDQNSQQSSLENLHSASIRSSDIRTPNTFINVGHPTFTTPLIIVGLPAGFVVLGLIKEQIGSKGRLRFICIITSIMVLGIVSHYEFYFFVLVGSILIISFRLKSGNLTYASIVVSLLVCALLNFTSPQHYYTSIGIFKTPLLILSLVFVSILWALYETKVLYKLYALLSRSHSFSMTSTINSRSIGVMKIVLVSVLVYLYLFTFVVLGTLSTNDIQTQVGTTTQRNIPWYLYPIKFGITGLLGLVLIASYPFKRFEKEIFVFGIIAVVALVAGPYYDEHRFSKYIMVGMVGFASILVYKIVSHLLRPKDDPRIHNNIFTTLWKPLASSIFLAMVVTMAALSVFMLAGYKELGYLSSQYQEDFYNIDFPSSSEMSLLNLIRADLPYVKTGFIAIQANAPETENLKSKLVGFSAIPGSRILQNPRSLNASTLEGLYSALENQNTKYLIFLKKDIDQEEQFSKPIDFILDNFPRVYEDDTHIVLKVPDLTPPSSEGEVDFGLIYNKRNELPPLSTILNDTKNNNNSSNDTILQYNYKFFNNIENKSQFIKIEKKGNKNENGTAHKENESGTGQIETLTLYGDKKARTLWSSPIKVQDKVNYVEGNFRLIAENKTTNNFGIKLEDDQNKQEYYASIDKNSLDLKQKSNLDNIKNKQLILSQDLQLIPEQRGLWHTIKILVLTDTMEVYLDDMLRIKIPKTLASNFNTISKIGITANNNIVQFEPLKIGYVPESSLKAYEITNANETYFHHYYPLSTLALSKLRYDTYLDGDSSVFSKRNVILTSDPKLELEEGEKGVINENRDQKEQEISQEKFNRYLEYVKSGGTLIVMNEDGANNNNINGNKSEGGVFSKFLSIRYGDKIQFNRIFGNGEYKSVNKYEQQQNEMNRVVSNKTRLSQQHFINISGLATKIDFGNSSDIYVKSYYANVNRDNNTYTIAPFAIEKKYGEGKIVLVNVAGYFDSIFKSKNQDFNTFVYIPKLIGLNSDKYQNRYPEEITTAAQDRIADEMKILNYTGIEVKSNSLLLNRMNGKSPSFNLTLSKISTSPHMTIKVNGSNYSSDSQDKYFNENSKLEQNTVSNITIRDLKLYGPYQVIINSTAKLVDLFPASSYYDYLALGIPAGFDTILKLYDGAYAEFTVISCSNNSYCQQTIRVSGDGEIFLHKIKADSQLVTYLSILVKSPEIRILNGSMKFKLDTDSKYPSQLTGSLLARGNIVANIDYVENYKLFNNETKTESVTYLKKLNADGTYASEVQEKNMLRLPGEISERAKDKGIGVPWKAAMISINSIIAMISIAVTMIVVKYYLLPRIKKFKQLYE
jgi:hypothetical protein